MHDMHDEDGSGDYLAPHHGVAAAETLTTRSPGRNPDDLGARRIPQRRGRRAPVQRGSPQPTIEIKTTNCKPSASQRWRREGEVQSILASCGGGKARTAAASRVQILVNVGKERRR
jgi:hypothetical protein